MHIRYLKSSFTAGEISPKMLGQVDFAQYQFGCEWLSNFIVWPQGMATRRPGTKYIAASPEPDTPVRLIPFEFSTEQAYAIEAGEGYFRFYMDQAPILDGLVPYEIEHDYDAYDLFDIYYCQSADIMYFAHPDYPPQMLSRTGHTSWTIEEIEFTNGPYLAQNTDATKTLGIASVTVPTPTDITGVADNGAGLIRVTAAGHGLATTNDVAIEDVVGVEAANGGWEVVVIDVDNFDLVGSTFSGTYVSGGTVKLCTVATWANHTIDADHLGSLWGHYNTTWGCFKIWQVLTDTTAAVEMKVTNSGGAATADWREGAWSTYRGFPAVVGFYENRLFWAATAHQPQTLWGSKSGDYYDHTPGTDDADPVAVTLNSDYVNAIKWISGQKVLLVGTSRGQWLVSATGTNEALTSSNIKAVQQTGLTSSGIMSRCDHTVLFWQQFGRNLMEIAYSLESDSYVATPLTIMADHLFRSDPVTEMTYLQEPVGSLWCTKYYGEMAVLTYERQHKVVAWSKLITDGDFESVIRIPGTDRDEIWFVVNRTINGSQCRYIELLEDLEIYEDDTEYMFYVDCGLTYTGVAATTISGLDHLVGETVAVLADGAVHDDCVVNESGEITLDRSATQVHAGLPYYSIMKPVRAEVKVEGGTIQNRRQRLVTLGMRLYKSYGGYISEDLTRTDVIPFKIMGEETDVPLEMFTGDKRVQFPGSFNRDGQYYILQMLPLPFNICQLTPRFEIE